MSGRKEVVTLRPARRFIQPEGPPVNFTESEFSDRLPVLFGSVTFILDEIILGKLPVVHFHDSITGNLGNNGGRRHGKAPGVTLDQRTLGYGEGQGVDAVNEKKIGWGRKLQTGLLHRHKRSPQDVNLIDLGRVDDSQAGGLGICLEDVI